MSDKVRNPLFTFPTKLTCGNFIAAKNELRWKPLSEYRKKAYAEIPVRVFYNKVNGTALCTGCGSRFLAEPSFRHNGKVKCPKCKKEAVLQNNRLFKSLSTYFNRVEADYFQKGKNGSMCRCDTVLMQEVFFDEHWDAILKRTEQPLSCTVIRSNGVRVRMMYTDAGWVLSNRDTFLTSPLSWWYGPRNLWQIKLLTPKRAVRGTHFERFYDSVPEHLRTSDGLMCITPQTEKLFKVGLISMGETYLQSLYHEALTRKRWCDVGLTDAPVAKMLGVTRKTLAAMIKSNAKTAEQFVWAERANLDAETVYSLFKDSTFTLKRLIQAAEKYRLNLKRIMGLFESDSSDVISDYLDYIEALKNYGDYPNDKRYLYPSREKFYDLHDMMLLKEESEKIRTDEDAKKDPLIAEFAEALSGFILEDDEFLVRPLRSVGEMYAESRLMSHCVRTYVTRYSERRLAIFSLRRISHPNTPIATIEIRKEGKTWKIAQMRGKHNAALPDDQKAWLNAWLSNVLNAKKKQKHAICA